MSFKIAIDALAIQDIVDRLAKFDATTLGDASILAINEVSKRGYESSITEMLSGINLTEEYVRSKTRLSLAVNPRAPQAVISADHGGLNPSTLSSYGATVRTAADTWDNARIEESGHKFAKWPGWTKRTGRAALGVPAGRKAVGFNVAVYKGEEDEFGRSASGNTYSFIIKAPNGQLLTVSRQKDARGAGSLKAMYGPSVWQLFRYTIPKIQPDLQADLESTLADEVNKAMEQFIL